MRNNRDDRYSFIWKAIQIHGYKYNYSKVVYKNCDEKVCIICPIHGEFWQTPYKHLHGRGCSKCGGTLKLTTEEFIEKAKKIHGDIYDYSKMHYINSNTKVCIICKEHGEFWQTPDSHLRGCGCPMCCGKYKTTENVIKEFREVHGDKYKYNSVKYTKANSYVTVTCPIHGDFQITPNKHLNGRGCPKCAIEYKASLRRKPLEQFVKEAKELHGNNIDYSLIEEYINTDTKVKLKCNKCGKIFYQTPSHHLHGDGCPFCKQSKMEKTLMKLLEENNIEYIHQCKFDWLKYKKELPLDFYLPKLNIAIECQGIQHFDEKHYFNEVGRYSFDNTILRDKIKFEKCLENNIKMLYICNKKDFNVEYAIENAEYFFDFETLLSYIKNKGDYYNEVQKHSEI